MMNTLMIWMLLTWLCSATDCEPLPTIGPMPLDLCEELRPLFELTPAGDGLRVVGICAQRESPA